MSKINDIIFHFNKKHLENPKIPMWVIKSKGETYYVNHVNVDKGVGFQTKENLNSPHTKGSIKFKGVLRLITDGDMVIANITNN